MPIQVKTTRSDYVAKSDDAIINDVCKNHNNMPKKCCHAQLDKTLMHTIKTYNMPNVFIITSN